jgi:hypothetical protein
MFPRSISTVLFHVLIAGVVGGVCEPASAGFYKWFDDQGRKHVSNIPRRGIRADGSLRDAYDPNSIVYQHRELLSVLRQHAAAIEREREREQARELAEARAAKHSAPTAARASIRRAAPKEGFMNLDDLIRLEKRGGRWMEPREAP